MHSDTQDIDISPKADSTEPKKAAATHIELRIPVASDKISAEI
jgi:hypothetical protein